LALYWVCFGFVLALIGFDWLCIGFELGLFFGLRKRRFSVSLCYNSIYVHLAFSEIGFVLHKRVYPNNPFYCGRLQSPMPVLSVKNVLNVAKATPPSIFDLPPWPRTFRSAS
jgi:hypothetical protein